MLITLQLYADRVRLKDGTVLYGTIKKHNRSILRIKTIRGTFTIPMRNVRSYKIDPRLIDPALRRKKKKVPKIPEYIPPKRSKAFYLRMTDLESGDWILDIRYFEKAKARKAPPKPWEPSGFTIGLITGGGLSVAQADVNAKTGYEEPKTQFKGSWQAGIAFDYAVIPFIDIHAEILWQSYSYGVLWAKSSASVDYEHNFQFQFLHFWLGARWKILPFLFTGAGLGYGVLTSGTADKGSTSGDVKEVFPAAKTSGNMAFYLEGGFRGNLSQRWAWSAALRIEGGLNKNFEVDTADSEGTKGLSHRFYGLIFGLHFQL